MLERLLSTEAFLTAQGALNGLAARHAAIADNIANVNTPGYKRKEVPFEVALARAARGAAASGGAPSRFGELGRMAKTMSSREVVDDDQVQLTGRETQVLRHLALGLSNNGIGRSLEISVETVKEHVQNVLRKLAVKDRTQAAVWAVRKGLV